MQYGIGSAMLAADNPGSPRPCYFVMDGRADAVIENRIPRTIFAELGHLVPKSTMEACASQQRIVLPPEVWCHVLSFLAGREVVRVVGFVNRDWLGYAREDAVWHALFLRRWSTPSLREAGDIFRPGKYSARFVIVELPNYYNVVNDPILND